MNIGVVTYCHCKNYGAELQACALQRVCERMGHDAKIIDFDRAPLTSNQKRIKWRRAIIKRIKRHPLIGFIEIADLFIRRAFAKFFKTKKEINDALTIRDLRFEEFWCQYEHHTHKYQGQLLSHLGFDAYIAGSDQIWNWMQTGDLSPYFLMFAEENAKKISYAASLSENTIPIELHEIYRKYLGNLNFISIREKQSVELLQPLSSKKVHLVLDPSFLLKKEDWAEIWSERIEVNQPYIFSYTLNASKRYVKIMCAYARKHNLKIINIASSPDVPRSAEIVNVFDAGPREFIYLLAHAKFVFTNSFHGTAFALNFNVPFLSVLNPVSETNSRVLSIVDLLGVSNRAVMDDEYVQALASAEENIDFVKVNKTCDEIREYSMRYLKGALNA